MKKIRTPRDLEDFLDGELSWRKKELITIKLMHDKARDHQAVMLRRAGIALLYAHWEGFVKSAGTAFVGFVSLQGLTYRQLRPNFSALGMKGAVLQSRDTERGEVLVRIAEFFLTHMDDKAILPTAKVVQTKSNLSSGRLRDILAILGLDYSPFQLREKTVIDRLVDQRNQIAHGQYLDIDVQDYSQLHHEVVQMLDEFRSQISNSAQSAGFRSTALPRANR